VSDTAFGDQDAEDEYDASDPAHDRIAVLRRVVAELRGGRDDIRRNNRRDDALRLVANAERDGLNRGTLADIRADLQAL
jgi:hypothetical protein